LNIATIADLIAYRRKNEKLVKKIAEKELKSEFGDFKTLVYQNTNEYAEHIVLVKGDVSSGSPLVRMHTYNILEDSLGDLSRGKNGQLQKAMQMISTEGKGAIVIIRSPNKAAVSDKVAPENATGHDELREYGIGAQILQDIGISDMILLTNSQKSVIGLEGYGIHIVGSKEIK
jgi:3,4-dihydroxy 2-butanone 4-phosphate synthase/GTP cyclohydrolase II